MRKNIRLTSPELSALWTQYMNDSMSICVFKHALKNVEDKDVYSIIVYALSLSQNHIVQLEKFFKQENYPIPIGFTEEDVNLEAPALFSDIFYLQYLYVMALHGMNGYSLSTGTAIRNDQRKYFVQCSKDTMKLFDQVMDTMLKKGVFIRPPFINPPHDVDFVTKQNYLTGWFGKRRPMNGIEIGNIYYNMQKNIVKIVLEIGFSQVTQTKELRQYFQRGAQICNKHTEIFGSIFAEEYLPSPKNWTTEITNSTVPPFSDKLMLFHIESLVAVAVGYYGAALSVCQRRDLITHYGRLMMEMGKYAEDGVNLLIKHGWFEQPPITDDRNELAKKK
ncbi:hypothetical protein HNQ94_001183 [Salirhabdus euzebyi]|uniref:DUF3231 family protein n=1 Tax=Salirhabdus euzebyi TaxID=394506 RepID=A0A841PUQ4_9BACI|nr:DUF3231 family protein [Salirhabdus euzebyi]MBB6452737.1 hypothetical protein [Salirhabdus euzebyi]